MFGDSIHPLHSAVKKCWKTINSRLVNEATKTYLNTLKMHKELLIVDFQLN
jgi:hypothetical protein